MSSKVEFQVKCKVNISVKSTVMSQINWPSQLIIQVSSYIKCHVSKQLQYLVKCSVSSQVSNQGNGHVKSKVRYQVKSGVRSSVKSRVKWIQDSNQVKSNQVHLSVKYPGSCPKVSSVKSRIVKSNVSQEVSSEVSTS